MGMSWGYGPTDEANSLQVLARAIELGTTFWDTAEYYGPYKNEELIAKALKKTKRSELILASKFSNTAHDGTGGALPTDRHHIRKALEGSLRRLGTDWIDLYYQHRLDPNMPVEESVGLMSELVKAGKIRFIGLCEVSVSTIRKAHAVHPITAVQSEYSLSERGLETSVLPTLRELGIGFVAYSPIGRGLLSGAIQKPSDLSAEDGRHRYPRFQEENLKRNLALFNALQKVASQNGVTVAQIALAWLLRQGEEIVPIPGTRHIQYLNDNAAAASIGMDDYSWEQVQAAVKDFKIFGDRYPEAFMKAIDQ